MQTIPKLGAIVLALLAHSVAQAQPEWPRTNPQHLSFFCGADAGEFADDSAPRGYAASLERELRAYERRGVDVARAMVDLRRRADCARFERRSTWSRVDSALLKVLNWNEESP